MTSAMTKIARQRYRCEAENCRLNAERAKYPADREAWLRLAEDWMKLARGTELIRTLQVMQEHNDAVKRH